MIMPSNPYMPTYHSFSQEKWETNDVKTIVFDIKNEAFSGQFYMLSLLGVGEAPISVASGHGERLSFSIKSLGSFTSTLNNAKSRLVGIRGPYGNKWPWESFDSVIAIAGGIGIPPIKSLIEEMEKSGRLNDLTVLYGARTPSDIVYKNEIEAWKKKMDLRLTVDKGKDGWEGNVGMITSLIPSLKGKERSSVFVIGPPIMMKNVVKDLLDMGFLDDRIFLSLERRMDCGIGVCGHCNIGKHYACEDGPIFNYSEIKNEDELF